MKNFKGGIIVFFCLLPALSVAQSMRNIRPIVIDKPEIIIDYASFESVNTRVPFRGDLETLKAGRQTGNAVFIVTYINFTAEQEAAFQYAVDIWSVLLHSDVPINITAEMKPLASGVLGSTGIPQQWANFDNAQKINTAYNVAMAEKMAGTALNNPSDPDMFMSFNNIFDWYFGTNGSTPPDLHDFVTVILHEIGHGLGFWNSTTVNSSGVGFYATSGIPNVYTRNLETGLDQNIVGTIQNASTTLGDVLTGDDVHWRSFLFPTDPERPRIYAPSTYSGGSSIAHLNEATYFPGSANSLMTPQIAQGESNHDPGLAYEMFQDMGWVSMDIDFPLFTDSEDSTATRTIIATIKGDSAVLAGGVDLHYSFAEFAGDTIVNMTPTGNVNEYTADIDPSGFEEEVSYYISVNAAGGKLFTSPGEAPNFFWQFVMAKDTIAPEIDHKPVSVVFLNNPVVSVVAGVTDNINADDLILTYKINSGATSTITVPLITSTTDGIYEGEYLLDWDMTSLALIEGDTVKYKLDVQDLAANPNLTTNPETGFYKIVAVDFNEPVAFYENDFNAPTTDFTGSGFVIGPETGFDSDAIHSDHPYRVIDGEDENDTLTHTYLLRTPIIISDKEALMSFDEMVLVEPGTDGTVYGDDEFWDYVIVEGSNDFGLSWLPVEDGYDSREQTDWLTRYNSAIDGQNSTALGDKGLYIKNELDLTGNRNFAAGDTLLLRFRMFIDPFAHGWGWAIDNLIIQIDQTAPVVTQITPSYLLIGDTEVTLTSKVEDNIELDSVIYEVDFNGVTQLTTFAGTASLFTLDLGFPAIIDTDVLKYRIIAVDKALNPNTTILPATGFFEIPVAVFGAAKTMYINDFNTPTDDFIGANFSIIQPSGFDDPAIISASPYPDAPFGTGELSYVLKYPITLNTTNSWVQYDEVALVEPTNDSVAFDVSKDGGVTWISVFDPYDASAQSSWNTTFNNFDGQGNSKGFGVVSIMKRRFFNILDNPELSGGEEVLVRFRMSVNDNVHGWGWLIDNFEIQGPTTAIEDELDRTIQVYPNPTNTGSVVLIGTLSGRSSRIVVTDVLGKIVLLQEVPISNNTLQTTLDLTSVKNGFYLISVSDDLGIYTSRIIVE